MATKIFPIKITPSEFAAFRLRAKEDKVTLAEMFRRWQSSDWRQHHPDEEYPDVKNVETA